METDFNTRIHGYVDVKDWTRPSWLNRKREEEKRKWEDNFVELEDGIQVRNPGVYFIYANFAFTGVGDKCDYKLQYGSTGDGRRAMWRKCEWRYGGDIKKVIPEYEQSENPSRMCYLGFAQHLEAGDEIKISFKNGNADCNTDKVHYGKRHHLNVLGIIKQ